MSKQILVDYIPFEVSPEQINESIKTNGKLIVGKKILIKFGISPCSLWITSEYASAIFST